MAVMTTKLLKTIERPPRADGVIGIGDHHAAGHGGGTSPRHLVHAVVVGRVGERNAVLVGIGERRSVGTQAEVTPSSPPGKKGAERARNSPVGDRDPRVLDHLGIEGFGVGRGHLGHHDSDQNWIGHGRVPHGRVERGVVVGNRCHVGTGRGDDGAFVARAGRKHGQHRRSEAKR